VCEPADRQLNGGHDLCLGLLLGRDRARRRANQRSVLLEVRDNRRGAVQACHGSRAAVRCTVVRRDWSDRPGDALVDLCCAVSDEALRGPSRD